MSYQLNLSEGNYRALKENLIHNYSLLQALQLVREINKLNNAIIIHSKLFIKEYKKQKLNSKNENQISKMKYRNKKTNIKNQITKMEYQKAYMKLLSWKSKLKWR